MSSDPAPNVETYFDALRQGDALMRSLGHVASPLPEAYCLITAGRKWWPEIRQVAETLRAQGIHCDLQESRGWFSRDFTVRCDDAALIVLHELGDRIRLT